MKNQTDNRETDSTNKTSNQSNQPYPNNPEKKDDEQRSIERIQQQQGSGKVKNEKLKVKS
jgi:hypothetical protein